MGAAAIRGARPDRTEDVRFVGVGDLSGHTLTGNAVVRANPVSFRGADTPKTNTGATDDHEALGGQEDAGSDVRSGGRVTQRFALCAISKSL